MFRLSSNKDQRKILYRIHLSSVNMNLKVNTQMKVNITQLKWGYFFADPSGFCVLSVKSEGSSYQITKVWNLKRSESYVYTFKFTYKIAPLTLLSIDLRGFKSDYFRFISGATPVYFIFFQLVVKYYTEEEAPEPSVTVDVITSMLNNNAFSLRACGKWVHLPCLSVCLPVYLSTHSLSLSL